MYSQVSDLNIAAIAYGCRDNITTDNLSLRAVREKELQRLISKRAAGRARQVPRKHGPSTSHTASGRERAGTDATAHTCTDKVAPRT